MPEPIRPATDVPSRDIEQAMESDPSTVTPSAVRATDEQIAAWERNLPEYIKSGRTEVPASYLAEAIDRVRQEEAEAAKWQAAAGALGGALDLSRREAARLREQVERVRVTASANATVAREAGNSEAERHSRDILILTTATEGVARVRQADAEAARLREQVERVRRWAEGRVQQDERGLVPFDLGEASAAEHVLHILAGEAADA